MQQSRSLFLNENPGFKVEASGKTEPLVSGPRITVDTAMLTATIWIEADREADVRTFVLGEDSPRWVAQQLCRRLWDVFLAPHLRVWAVRNRFEPVRRVVRCPASFEQGSLIQHKLSISFSFFIRHKENTNLGNGTRVSFPTRSLDCPGQSGNLLPQALDHGRQHPDCRELSLQLPLEQPKPYPATKTIRLTIFWMNHLFLYSFMV